MDLCTYRRKFKNVAPIALMREFYHDSNLKSSSKELKTYKGIKTLGLCSLLGNRVSMAEKFTCIIKAQTSREHPEAQMIHRSKSANHQFHSNLERYPSQSINHHNTKKIHRKYPTLMPNFPENFLNKTNYYLQRDSQCGIKKISSKTDKSWFPIKEKQNEYKLKARSKFKNKRLVTSDFQAKQGYITAL